MIYVKLGIHAKANHMVSPDFTATRIRIEDHRIPAISVLVPLVDQDALAAAIESIRNAVRLYGQGYELIIAGDFN
jgi:hypothetical protein